MRVSAPDLQKFQKYTRRSNRRNMLGGAYDASALLMISSILVRRNLLTWYRTRGHGFRIVIRRRKTCV